MVNALVCGTRIHGFNSHYPPQLRLGSWALFIKVISIQKSFTSKKKTLFLIATPIGNLHELTPRAVETLSSVDVVVCENTFLCLKLLRAFDIKAKKILLYDNIKEKSDFRVEKFVHELSFYERVALLSSAGYPLVSDPGRKLVRKWIDVGYYVVPISGSSAVLDSIVASGFYYHNFTFIGFLPRRTHKQKTILSVYAQNFLSALIIYETVKRIENTLIAIRSCLGNRMIALCREITKLNEEFIRGSVEDVIKYLKDNLSSLRGELVIIVSVELGGLLLKNRPLRIKACKKFSTGDIK